MDGDGATDRFDVSDERWREHLTAKGYVVIAQVMGAAQLVATRDAIWDGIEQTAPGVSRADARSWHQWRLDRRGFLLQSAVAQGVGAWGVRSLPRVRSAFEQIWGTEDLIVSMDAVIAWRPWWVEAAADVEGGGGNSWRPQTEGLHLDQNPFDKEGLSSVQGMVPLHDVTALTGGLEVVPRSHLPEAKAELKRRFPDLAGAGDWCPGLSRLYPPWGKNKPQLVTARAGDLVLWDSRTVHGGKVGAGGVEPAGAVEGAVAAGAGAVELARLSVTVCMTPRAWASDDVLQIRRDAFASGRVLTHWPHEAPGAGANSARTAGAGHVPIVLSEEQRALL